MKWCDLIGEIQREVGALMARIGSVLLATTKRCRACAQRNRVVHGRVGARCGKCGFPLGDEKL